MTRHDIETAAGEAFGHEPDPVEASLSWRPVIIMFAVQLAAIGAFVWVLA